MRRELPESLVEILSDGSTNIIEAVQNAYEVSMKIASVDNYVLLSLSSLYIFLNKIYKAN